MVAGYLTLNTSPNPKLIPGRKFCRGFLTHQNPTSESVQEVFKFSQAESSRVRRFSRVGSGGLFGYRVGSDHAGQIRPARSDLAREKKQGICSAFHGSGHFSRFGSGRVSVTRSGLTRPVLRGNLLCLPGTPGETSSPDPTLPARVSNVPDPARGSVGS